MRSNGPVVEFKVRDTTEVTTIARQEREVVRQRNGRDFCILGTDTQFLSQEILEMNLTGLIEGNARHPAEKIKALKEVAVALDAR